MQVNESKAEPGRAREHSRAVAARQARGARQSREGLSKAKQGNAREQGKATQSKGSQQHTHTQQLRVRRPPPSRAARPAHGRGLGIKAPPKRPGRVPRPPTPWPWGHGGAREGTVACAREEFPSSTI